MKREMKILFHVKDDEKCHVSFQKRRPKFFLKKSFFFRNEWEKILQQEQKKQNLR